MNLRCLSLVIGLVLVATTTTSFRLNSTRRAGRGETEEECNLELEECTAEYEKCENIFEECRTTCGEDIECVAGCDTSFEICQRESESYDCAGDYEECICMLDPEAECEKTTTTAATTEEEPETTTDDECGCTKPPECPCGGEGEDEDDDDDDEWNGEDPDDEEIEEFDPCQDVDDWTYLPDLRNCHYYWACVKGHGWKFKCPPKYPVFDWRREMCVKGKRRKYCDKPFCGKQDKEKPCAKRIKSQCKKYRQCLRGKIIPKHCPDGYSFDDNTQRCEPDWLADCLNCPLKDKNHEVMKFPDKKDCNRYYVCSRSDFYPQKCCAKLHFNEKKERCEDSKTAGCKYGKESYMNVMLGKDDDEN